MYVSVKLTPTHTHPHTHTHTLTHTHTPSHTHTHTRTHTHTVAERGQTDPIAITITTMPQRLKLLIGHVVSFNMSPLQ